LIYLQSTVEAMTFRGWRLLWPR